MKMELDKSERQIILNHLQNSPIPYAGEAKQREVRRIIDKFKNCTD